MQGQGTAGIIKIDCKPCITGNHAAAVIDDVHQTAVRDIHAAPVGQGRETLVVAGNQRAGIGIQAAAD